MNNRSEETLFKFILRERFITLTVIGGIFTFAFIGSLKEDIIDPVMYFMLPHSYFDFMNITIREGEKYEIPERHIELKIGNFFRSLITWLLMLTVLYVLYKYTNFPDVPNGNFTGAALPR